MRRSRTWWERGLTLGTALAALGSSACPSAPRSDAGALPEQGRPLSTAPDASAASPLGARMAVAIAPDAGTPVSARYELDGQSLVLTLADGVAIRAALLAEIEKSSVEHRDLLLASTRNAPVEIEDGLLRIAFWWLQARGDHLSLMRRMGPHPVALFYGATVRRENNQWRVSDLGPGFIHWKR